MNNIDNNFKWFEERIYIQDEETFKKYLKLKGIERIKKAYMILKPHLKKVTDKDIADIYKYDLRLRRNIYYYITMFEVFLRAQLSNNFTKDDFDLNKYDLISGDSLFEILEESTFGKLIGLYEDLKEHQIDELMDMDMDKSLFIRRSVAVKDLRNAVFHHNFLLDFTKYANCEINGLNTCTLLSNLVNFYRILPDELKGRFVKRINRTDDRLKVPRELKIELEFHK